MDKLILKYYTILLLLSYTSAYSNTNVHPSELIDFQHISVSEGLKNSRVVSILQDSLGYMWFATHNGLEKFSGSDIQHYSLSYDTTFYSQDNIVNCIELSEDYDIICGTKSGNIYYYQRKLNSFTPLIKPDQNDDFFNIHSLYSDTGKGVWIGTTGTLYFYNNNTKTAINIKSITTGVVSIAHHSKDKLWLATSKGLQLLDKNTLATIEIKHTSEDTKVLNHEDIMAIYPVAKNRIAICMRDAQVFIIEYLDNQINLIENRSFSFNDKKHPIRDIKTTPQNGYAIAMDGVGIVITDSNLNTLNILNSNDDEGSSLSSNGVYKLYIGDDDIMWVATYGGGVNFYDPNKKPFEIVKHVPYINNSLINNTVNDIIEDNEGNIWYGTKKGISIFNPSSKKWRHIPALNKIGRTPIQVMKMDKDQLGNIWVASYGNGLIKINTQNYKREYYTKKHLGYRHAETNHLYHVICDSENRIWSGGIWGTVTMVNPIKQTSQKINVTNVRCIYEDDKQIMIGTLFGLFFVDKNTLNVTRPNHTVLIENRIITISKHPDKNIIYFGTDLKGVITWDRDDDQITLHTSQNGMPADYIRSIVWDDYDKMWVSSTGGITSFNSKGEIIANFSQIDGLSNTEFSENSVCKLSNGKIIFGGIDGSNEFYPNQIIQSKQTTTPILTGLKISGTELTITPKGPLTENINIQKSIELKHNQNSLNISFSAIGYSTPEKIKYRWMLEGLETQWNSAEGIKEAIYPLIPPGSYTFKVMSTNDDHIWQEEIKTIEIYIADPFWKTPLAYILYMLIIGGIVMLILHYSHTIVQEKHYEEKQQFFISIAHDLRTPLSLIKLPIDKMLDGENSDVIESKNLSLVKRNVDRLTNLVNQLLDFQKSDLQKMHLQVDSHQLNKFILQRIEIFKPLANEKNILLEFIKCKEDISLWFDNGKMEKIMYNLLSNAIKYTPNGGKVKVEARCENKKCYISVSDTGEGIPKNQQKNIFQRYYRATNAINSQEVGSGVGLVLTKQLVELHHGKISFTSELGKGTSFSFFIPLGKEQYNETNFISNKNEISQLLPISPIEETQERTDEGNTTGLPKLLLVEDNPELLESLAHELSNEHQVFKAENGELGLQLAKSEMPDIIVSDVMMPVMNGHQLCLKIKGDLSVCHIPIILLTALDSVDYKREGLEHGADAYVEKPFDLKMLKAQIKNLLKNRNMLKQKFLIPSTGVAEVSPTNNDHEFLEKIQTYVIENLDNEKLSVENTARELGMSRPVLYRKIKALTDLSPQQFVMNIKLKEAARIIKEENKNISETAYLVGFSDPKYFSQTFKKHFGITPSQYLKK